MTVTKVAINPQDSGYAIILNDKNGKQFVIVMTKKYIERVLVPTIKSIAPSYQNPTNDPEKDAKTMEKIMLQAAYTDRTPHMCELVDALYDYNDSEDKDKVIIEMKKHYNLFAGGTILAPPYPEYIPSIFIPLLSSPI